MRRTLACGIAGALLTAPAVAGAQYYAPDPPPADVPWYQLVELGAFVDGYAGLNYNFPRPHADANRLRAYDQNTGLALSWVGVDAVFRPDPVGGTLSLRYGPSADRLADRCLHEDRDANPCDGDVGLEMVQQAFGSFRPGGSVGVVRLDFGKFDAGYGLEVAEGYRNTTYTRGLLYSLATPVFFSGVRANVRPLPDMELSFVIASGQNSTLDNNFGKTLSVQLALKPTPSFTAKVGWVAGPEQDDSTRVTCPAGQTPLGESGSCAPASNDPPGATYGVGQSGVNHFDAFRHHGDLVLVYRVSSHLTLAWNGILGLEGVKEPGVSGTSSALWYGGALSVDVPLSSTWSIGARGEYLADEEGRLTGIDDAKLTSATLTFDARLAENLLLRLDNRADVLLSAEGSKDVFPVGVVDRAGPEDARPYQLTTTLGVIAHTN